MSEVIDGAAPQPTTDEDPIKDAREEARKYFSGYSRVQFLKKSLATVALSGSVIGATLNAASPLDGLFENKPNRDRWAIKTNIPTGSGSTAVTKVDITAFAKMGPPTYPGRESDYKNAFLPGAVDGLREGMMVSTEGYIHLAHFDHGDSDYHIQINDRPTNGVGDLTPCVIVEVPHPNATADPELRVKYAQARKVVRDLCFNGGKPTSNGWVAAPPKVRVTGQLFFDLHHKPTPGRPGGGRGKNVFGIPMPATTVWEIHPVTEITRVE